MSDQPVVPEIAPRRRFRLSDKNVAAVFWTTFAITVIVILVIGSVVATNEQNAARHDWGTAITGKITSYTTLPDVYNVWSYGFSFTSQSGKTQTWTTLLPPNKKIGSKITLWEGTDGNVFVRGSLYTVRKWGHNSWRNSPWPVTQGTYLGALVIGLLLGAGYGITMAFVIAPAAVWFFTAPWWRTMMLGLGLIDDDEEEDVPSGAAGVEPA